MKSYENEYVMIDIDKSVPCLVWIGKKYMPSAEFRQSEEKYLQCYLEHCKTYPNLPLFIDARNIGVLSPKDTQWVVDTILPQLVDAGMTREAFVVAKGLSKMTVTHYKTAAGATVEIAEFETIEIEKDPESFVTTLWLSNPPVNTIGSKMLDELNIALDMLFDDYDTRVIVVRGKANCFSAGADLAGGIPDSPWAFKKYVRKGQKTFKRFREIPKPVIASVLSG